MDNKHIGGHQGLTLLDPKARGGPTQAWGETVWKAGVQFPPGFAGKNKEDKELVPGTSSGRL